MKILRYFYQKKTMLQKSILCLAAVLLLSACSSNFSLMKRRYTKGFYIAAAKHSTTPKHEAAAKKLPATSVKDQPGTVAVAAPETSSGVLAPASTPANSQAATLPAAKKTRAQAAAAHPNAAPLKETKQLHPVKQQQATKETRATTAANSDSRLIIMVILCFLWWLNLIAVYMHDKDITLNFWITLLLDLTVIGGIIFSLLVVLDIVDLR